MQALGGTGGLKVGADFLKQLNPDAKVLISDPSWENHRALFDQRRLRRSRPTPTTTPPAHGIDFDGMMAALNAAPAGTIVVLHACCHNPTGDDLTPEQWDQVVAAVKARGLVPFLDMAYQGFGDGIAEDGAAVRQFVAAGIDLLRVDLVLEELLAVRRARRRAVGGVRTSAKRPRACCRS